MARLTQDNFGVILKGLSLEKLLKRHKEEVAAYLEIKRLIEMIEDFPNKIYSNGTSYDSLNHKLKSKAHLCKKLDALIHIKLTLKTQQKP